jgi:glycosyltransferase involved in cell wall biosynthesis
MDAVEGRPQYEEEGASDASTIRSAEGSAPVFCIVDPSLRDFVGHYFAYDASIIRAAQSMGYRAMVLGPRDADAAITAAVPLVAAFRRGIWERHPWTRHLSGLARRAVDHVLCARDFGADLRGALTGVRLPPGSVVLGHMITAKHLPGFAREAERLPPDVTLVLLLRYQPLFYDHAVGDRAFRRLEALAKAGRRIRIASDSARLAREIGRLTRLPVEVLPIPHVPDEAAVTERASGAPLRFASLGGARDEKGYLEILQAIELLRAEPEGLAGLEFLLQSNDPAPDVQAAMDAFAARRPPEVRLLRHALDEADYAALLREADVVLLPYWRSIYMARTSGVFLEALAAGKPVIATEDTWMSDELALHGAGLLVPDRDPAALAAAIRRAAREHRELASRAQADRAQVLARHNARALIARCLDPAPRPAPPPRLQRVAMFYPWNDLQERRAGASLRCNLVVDALLPHVAAVEVLQSGPAPPVRRGKLRISAMPPRLRHPLPRWVFRCLAFPLVGRAGWGQELFLWWHLERLADPFFRRRVREMVREADAVLLEYSFWGSIVLAACRRYGVPCVLTQHDVLSQQVTRSRLLRRLTFGLEAAALRGADHAVCVSPTDRDAFAAAGLDARVIVNAIDLTRFDHVADDDPRAALRDEHGIVLPPGPIVLFVGSRHPPNLAAVERLRETAARSPGAAFVVAGRCAEPGLHGNLLATGVVADRALALLYQAAALVVVPLEAGTGSSLKTVEAMAAGRPVLGTGVAFRGMDVIPGTDCIQEDELSRWPATIEGLLSDHTRAAAIGEAGRRVAERYDHRRVFAAYLELLGLRAAARARQA